MRQYVYVTGSPLVHVWLGGRELACGKRWTSVGVCTSLLAKRCRTCDAYIRGWLDGVENYLEVQP